MGISTSGRGSVANGLRARSPVGQFEIGPARNFVYLLVDWKTRDAAVVDPQADLAPLDDAILAHGLTLRTILLTHTHWDHVAGLWKLMRQFPEATAHGHALELHRLVSDGGPLMSRVHPLQEGDTVGVGTLAVRVLHTPGHSAGECCFLVDVDPPLLFTGDTLFIRDCGRTDLPSGDTAQMFASLQRLKALPPDAIVLPGHHYAVECTSTIADELRTSPPLRVASVEELGALP